MASIAMRTGVLGVRLAAHLLRRATYYVTPERINQFALLTADQAVDILLTPSNLLEPDGAISWETGNPIFELGNHTGGEVLDLPSGNVIHANILWRVYESIYDQTATWKIANWFASIYSVKAYTSYGYAFWRLMHSQVHTDLKTLATKVTVDSSMMIYLNNQSNNKGSNENYAREFLELFTILKGEAIAVDNYTNYTEHDITLAAKAISGYRINSTNVDTDTGLPRALPTISRHDTTVKTFSDAFTDPAKPTIHIIQGAQVTVDMDRELSDFIEMIFNQLETARAYVRKMYRYFVGDIINAEIEADVIEPLAIQLKGSNNDYDHISVLRTLLKSLHFYDEDDTNTENEIIGSKIKSPYEMLYHSVNLLNIPQPNEGDNLNKYKNNASSVLYHHMSYIGLNMRGPITVEGYAGFYDGPSYSKNWFSSNFMFRRFTYGLSIKRGKVRNTNSYFPFFVDLVQYVSDTFEVPGGPGNSPIDPQGVADAYRVINGMLSYFFPEMPVGDRYTYFENALLGGLSPINWYFSWIEYLATNDDTNVRVGLESLYDAILSSPEFQIF